MRKGKVKSSYHLLRYGSMRWRERGGGNEMKAERSERVKEGAASYIERQRDNIEAKRQSGRSVTGREAKMWSEKHNNGDSAIKWQIGGEEKGCEPTRGPRSVGVQQGTGCMQK
jgi:hypothetical protein